MGSMSKHLVVLMLWTGSVEWQAGPGLIRADGYECALISPWLSLFRTPAVLEMLHSQGRRRAGCLSRSWSKGEAWVKKKTRHCFSQRPEDLPAWLFPGYLIFSDNYSHIKIKFGQYLLMTRTRVRIERTKVKEQKHVVEREREREEYITILS